MGFMRKVAQVGTFGLAGLAGSGDKKKAKPAPGPSLVTGDYNKPPATSLVNSTPSLY